jgi:hypothetical protein
MGTPTHLIGFQIMPDDNDIPEIAAPPVAVEETNRLFRLVPVGNDSCRSTGRWCLFPLTPKTKRAASRRSRIRWVAIGATQYASLRRARRRRNGMSSAM